MLSGQCGGNFSYPYTCTADLHHENPIYSTHHRPQQHHQPSVISSIRSPNHSIMSCCSGKCGCGSSCSCGSGCNGCGMYPDVEKSATAAMIVDGVAPKPMYGEESESSFVAEGGHGCKCGDNCKCNPCNC
ncbi:hypothetical protein L1987_50881 [Smallanthus sonchifolius]|uniref:Uncharacterized protein n=1 Tax=Smallanthus sonchifolius TaxID=185202 RepID=A0ACB9EP29_9ASTR|nr:hypothetical protein L1987_50881 [Smallanthus sonchifolius]